jgi:hypothetical protein
MFESQTEPVHSLHRAGDGGTGGDDKSTVFKNGRNDSRFDGIADVRNARTERLDESYLKFGSS